MNELEYKIISLSIDEWSKRFVGISGIDLSSRLGITNEEVMIILEKLESEGKGTLNRNVQLYSITTAPNNPKFEIPKEPTTTHVFFPAKELLVEHYYNSDLVRSGLPEYKIRLHHGGHQLEMVFFSDEVLTRYMDHPEYYYLNDSLAGGGISTKSESPASRYLYVRYGKRKFESGESSVTAILKDLSAMADEEQRYWHSHEIKESNFSKNDPNFGRFIARNYEGEFVNYPSPLKDLSDTLDSVNAISIDGKIFGKVENSHLRFPVENTYKSFCDCCSELYKLIGPDNLKQKGLKKILKNRFLLKDSDFVHEESKRPLSSLQLLYRLS